MDYLYARWLHDNQEYPVEFFSEIDAERFETRKIEIFKDASFGIASDDIIVGDTQLGDVPVPPLEEINEQEEFEAYPITASAFEIKWHYYLNLISADKH